MKTKLIVVSTVILLATPVFAQSAGTSLTGTSNGSQGTPGQSAPSSNGQSMSGSSAGASGATGGSNAGQQSNATAEQHEKLGN